MGASSAGAVTVTIGDHPDRTVRVARGAQGGSRCRRPGARGIIDAMAADRAPPRRAPSASREPARSGATVGGWRGRGTSVPPRRGPDVGPARSRGAHLRQRPRRGPLPRGVGAAAGRGQAPAAGRRPRRPGAGGRPRAPDLSRHGPLCSQRVGLVAPTRRRVGGGPLGGRLRAGLGPHGRGRPPVGPLLASRRLAACCSWSAWCALRLGWRAVAHRRGSTSPCCANA